MEDGDVTRLLNDVNDGNPAALNEVVALMHDQLSHIARIQLSREADGHTLETSGLVSEAYLRLLGVDRITWRNRQHLLAMASRAMRRVLIDYADRRRAKKRGGADDPVTLGDTPYVADANHEHLLALDDALERLERLAPRQSEIVECRFFGGLSIEETAVALALSPATVKRDWTAARAWLNRELAS